MILLAPSDPLRAGRVDPHFADEASAARAVGADVALVDHDLWQRATTPAEADAVLRRVGQDPDVVYRGWMVDADHYALLEAAVVSRGARLRTSAARYRRAHELPGWYDALTAVTAQACWTTGPDLAAFAGCLRTLGSGAAVLRDYTKSLKHHWHEAVLVPDVSDETGSLAVAQRFLELRGDDFDGGLVLRRFEDFEGPEVRTWWVDGSWALSTAHPDTPDDQPDVPAAFLATLAPAIGSLDLPFVTADVVRRTDGRWRLVEIGDGQVSDRPRSCPAGALVGALVRPAGRTAEPGT